MESKVYGLITKVVAAVGVVALSFTTLPANANLLTNGNFAEGAPASGCAAGITSLPGWTFLGGNIDIVSPAGCGGFTAPGGNTYLLDLTGSFAEDGENDVGDISQTVTTQVGTQYALSFYFGGNSQWQGSGFPNDSPIKSMNVLLDGSLLENYAVNTAGVSTTDGQFELETLDFTATSTTTSIAFQSLNGLSADGIASDFGPLLAGVDLAPVTVPEPATLSLLGLGLVGVGFMTRRRVS